MATTRTTMIIALWLTLSTKLVIANNAQCPANLVKNEFLIQNSKNCYEFVLDHPGDWYHASADCVSKGGNLTDIHTFAEQGFIINSVNTLMKSHTEIPDDSGVWIGFTDENTEGRWRWTSGATVGFTNWASGQPGVVGSFENCCLMEFSNTGLWHDYPCHGIIFTVESHGWVCKYPLAA